MGTPTAPFVLILSVPEWSVSRFQCSKVILTDLSKAFGCLPPRLVVAKMQAYLLSDTACALTASYFAERKQCVKINGKAREWRDLLKCAPQGSILGSFIFNIFLNDLLLKLGCLENCDLYNYADDNTAGVCGRAPDEVCSGLERNGSLCYIGSR